MKEEKNEVSQSTGQSKSMLYTSYAADGNRDRRSRNSYNWPPSNSGFSIFIKHLLDSDIQEDEPLAGMKNPGISHTGLVLSQALLEAHIESAVRESHLHSSSPIDLHVDSGDEIRLI